MRCVISMAFAGLLAACGSNGGDGGPNDASTLDADVRDTGTNGNDGGSNTNGNDGPTGRELILSGK